MDTNTDHFTPLTLRVQVNYKPITPHTMGEPLSQAELLTFFSVHNDSACSLVCKRRCALTSRQCYFGKPKKNILVCCIYF